jgi:hypothetical protein
MKATVIEVTENQIYLQIDDQLRFKARYETGGSPVSPHRTDTVDFDFHNANVPAIVIHSVLPPMKPGFLIG